MWGFLNSSQCSVSGHPTASLLRLASRFFCDTHIVEMIGAVCTFLCASASLGYFSYGGITGVESGNLKFLHIVPDCPLSGCVLHDCTQN